MENRSLEDLFGMAAAHKPLLSRDLEKTEQHKHAVLMADGFSLDLNGYGAEDVSLICASVLRCIGLPLDEEPVYGLTLAGQELVDEMGAPAPMVNFFFDELTTIEADDDEELLVEEIA